MRDKSDSKNVVLVNKAFLIKTAFCGLRCFMKDSTKQNLKHIINLLSSFLAAAIAFLLIAGALRFDSYTFINEHRVALIWSVFALLVAMYIAYVLFYIFEKTAAHRLILLCFICGDILGAIFYGICASGIILKITSVDALRDYIDDFGAWMPVLYVLFSFLQVVVLPVPGSVSVAAGVALFGVFESIIYSFIGIVLGSVVAFAIGRVIGYKAVCWIVGEDTLKKWLEKLKGKDYLILSLMFLLPMFPDDVLCFVAGLSSMSWSFFIIMIAVTRLISITTTACSFNFIPFNTWWGILIWVLMALAVVAAFVLVMKYSDKIDKFLKSRFKGKKRK